MILWGQRETRQNAAKGGTRLKADEPSVGPTGTGAPTQSTAFYEDPGLLGMLGASSMRELSERYPRIV